MITICSQPDNNYFHWQNLIQFYNLQRLGMLEDHRAVFLVREGTTPSKFILKFKELFPDNVFIYSDGRIQKHYIPTIKIHGIVKYLEQNTRQTDLMLIDSDVIFREPIDYSLFTEDNTVYCSDTKGYLGYQYLKTKGESMLKDMCDFTGVNVQTIIDKNDRSGGAQLYYKGVSDLLGYFKEVEDLSPKLYDLMLKHPTYNDFKPPIQAWTSEMWCVLWLLWKRGIETEIHQELDFRWATDPIELWDTTKILHMAGVTKDHKGKFYKGNFINKNPFLQNYDYVESNSITTKYIEEMMSTEKDPRLKILIESL